MPDALTQLTDKVAGPLKASAIVLPMALILITVLSQADTELIRPDTQISLEKINLPSGTLFSPLLGLKLSVFGFYALAPLIVFALHWTLLRLHPEDGEEWAHTLRVVGEVLAPVTLFVLLWRFAPYAHARPDDVPGLSAGRALSYLHGAALICDTALILYARMEAVGQAAALWRSRSELLRRIGLALRATMQAGLLFLLVFVPATLIVSLIPTEWAKTTVGPWIGLTHATAALVVAVLAGVLAWPAFAIIRYVRNRKRSSNPLNPSPENERGAAMSIYAVLLTALVASVALPDLGRPLNLTGARLAAAEPSEAIIAAMIASKEVGPERARHEAWRLFGRGLDYTRWQFAGASFDGAVMPLIRLDQADLSSASLIRTDMVGAHLIGTKLGGAVLSEADLRNADLSCVNAPDAANCVKLAQAQGTRPAPAAPPPSAAGKPDACIQPGGGPKLDRALLTEATLTRADLSGASLRAVNFTKVKDLTGAKFIGADLTGAVFTKVTFGKVNLSSACLCGADLRNANLEDAALTGATLRNADLRDAIMPANLQGIDFNGANIKGTIFKGDPPNLQSANLIDVVQADDYKAVCKQASGPQPAATR